jgi:hypothetical protein
MNARLLYYAAAAATAIAGILHIILAPDRLGGSGTNTGVLFLVGGIAQVFWALPMARRWGKIWYGIGIGGTAVLMTIWAITRMPGNPITGRGGGVNEMAIAVEAMQGIFIGLAVAILAIELRMKRLDKKTASSST